MPSIELTDVSVAFPIYSAASRSLKNAVFSATTGGHLGSDSGHVMVQALSRVSLRFENGDRVALIGHNGAGKTTLLRVLAGIYEPGAGSVTVEGRVTPMFDVSLGIDPESTGNENIILRGLFLGLTRAQIMARRKDVAEFAALGAFLDLPVRTYSAGMQARLAFAMATCIEPEILLLDEGIAVGDANFALKANKRLERFIAGTGVLVFASHSETLIRRFCNKAVVLEHGEVKWSGDLEEGIRLHANTPLE